MAVVAVNVGTTVRATGGVTSFAHDSTVAVPAGALAIVLVAWVDQTGIDANSVVESLPSAGATWTRDAQFRDETLDAHMGAAIFSAPAPSGFASGTRYTVTFSSNMSWGGHMAVIYLTGADTGGSRVDGTPVGTFTANPGTVNWTAGAITIANTDSGLIAYVFADGVSATGTSTPNAPFAELNQTQDAANDWTEATNFAAATSSGSQSATGVWNQSPNFGSIRTMIAYKAAGGAAQASPPMYPIIVGSEAYQDRQAW